ncbi:MAG: small multi-drug export protein [Patescibacteria group bacterium]|nr:small multi-drug export protein [Patescibacteria group bacterium]MDD4304370.1 small multi-drug export protein [Patescibacteria group bacterium]MDD4695393.1 small multi-drug export protein [Patescibacteria group bacterium]
MELIQKILESKELLTIIYAALPITELRGSIPIAIGMWNIKPIIALILSIIGNTIPIFILILGLNKIVEISSRYSKFWTNFINSIFKRTRKKTYEKFQKYGLFALFLFVAIPLPLTGAWTGSIAAWLFGINIKKAFWPIFIGIIVSGIIVTLITIGALSMLKI